MIHVQMDYKFLLSFALVSVTVYTKILELLRRWVWCYFLPPSWQTTSQSSVSLTNQCQPGDRQNLTCLKSGSNSIFPFIFVKNMSTGNSLLYDFFLLLHAGGTAAVYRRKCITLLLGYQKTEIVVLNKHLNSKIDWCFLGGKIVTVEFISKWLTRYEELEKQEFWILKNIEKAKW